MGYCDGTKTTYRKCIYYDKDEGICLKQGFRPPKDLYLRIKGIDCKARRVSKDKVHYDEIKKKQELESYIPKELKDSTLKSLISDMISGLGEDDLEEFKAFKDLDDREQVLVYKVAIMNEHPKKFANELYGDYKNPKNKVRSTLAKPNVIRAIEEMHKSTKGLLKTSITSIAKKGLDALEDGIHNLKYQTLKSEGLEIDNLKHIVELNEKIAKIYNTYTHIDENGGNGLLITFGDKSTLQDLMKTSKELTFKEVRND